MHELSQLTINEDQHKNDEEIHDLEIKRKEPPIHEEEEEEGARDDDV